MNCIRFIIWYATLSSCSAQRHIFDGYDTMSSHYMCSLFYHFYHFKSYLVFSLILYLITSVSNNAHVRVEAQMCAVCTDILEKKCYTFWMILWQFNSASEILMKWSSFCCIRFAAFDDYFFSLPFHFELKTEKDKCSAAFELLFFFIFHPLIYIIGSLMWRNVVIHFVSFININ